MTAIEIIEKWRVSNSKTQEEMAQMLGLKTQQNYNDLKTGRTKKISVEIAQKFKELSGINVLNGSGFSRENNVNDFQKDLLAKKNTHVPFMVPLVPVKAQAGYAMSYPDTQHFSESLEKYPMLPGISYQGAEWRYFEVEGDSMIPTLFDKDYILVSAVLKEDWQDVKPNKPYVVVLHEDVFVKFIYQVDRQTWILASANRKVKHKKISVEDVKELWVFRGRTTKNLDIPKIEIKV